MCGRLGNVLKLRLTSFPSAKSCSPSEIRCGAANATQHKSEMKDRFKIRVIPKGKCSFVGGYRLQIPRYIRCLYFSKYNYALDRHKPPILICRSIGKKNTIKIELKRQKNKSPPGGSRSCRSRARSEPTCTTTYGC